VSKLVGNLRKITSDKMPNVVVLCVAAAENEAVAVVHALESNDLASITPNVDCT
jgi:hypothetical protein